MICTFLGNKDAPQSIKRNLKRILVDLIENHNVYSFYVGNQGNFDKLSVELLEELKELYSHINYVVVLAYRPQKNRYDGIINETNSLYPEELAQIHPKFAIDRRNKWMIEKSTFVISYVRHVGGAAKYKELALKKGKTVIELFDSVDGIYDNKNSCKNGDNVIE